MRLFAKATLWLCVMCCAGISVAETAYVTDECEITLRRGQGNSFGILRLLKSGAAVNVLESTNDGYTHVTTEGGVSGWVVSRYLVDSPVARDRYEQLKQEYDRLKSQFDARLEARSQDLLQEIDKLKELAKRPLDLQQENAELKQSLTEEAEKVARLTRENEVFKSPHKDRQWFILGVSTALGSLILGMVLTRVPWRKKKRWGQL